MTATGPSRSVELAQHSAIELILTSILLFGVTTIVRFVVGPSAISRAFPQIHVELLIVGLGVGVLLTGLIKSPLGKISGGHTNPAISLAMWRFWCVSCSRNTPLCGRATSRLSIWRGCRTGDLGKTRGTAAGVVRRHSARSRLVSGAAVSCRGRRHGCHRLHCRILPLCPAARSLGALACWDFGRARHCDARHTNGRQPKSRTSVWARCGLWTHGQALGVPVGSDGGSRSSSKASQNSSTASPSAHAQTMWH